MSGAAPDSAGGDEPGSAMKAPRQEADPCGACVLVYGLLAVFAIFSAVYSWHSVVRQRTTHLSHFADLAAVGTNSVIEERLRQLGEVLPRSPALVGIARGFRVLYPGWVGLAVRGSNKRLRVLFGSMPPKMVRCATEAGCVAALEPATSSRNGAKRLWLVRTVDGRTVYGALPGAMLDRLWSQFPACLADAFELRGPYGRSVRLRSAEATATERVLRSAGNTGLALGVGATDASLRAEWWAIV